MNNIDKIKSTVDFLNPDANINHDYKLVKTRKSQFNVSSKNIKRLFSNTGNTGN